MAKHIFVFGLGEFHRKYLKRVPHAERYEFHSLLDYEEILSAVNFPFAQMLEKAEKQLRDFPDEISGIITHWDFPASTMLPILCEKFGLRSASLNSVLKCEHKYWSRLEQQEVAPEMTPEFCAVDPFADDVLDQISLEYPYWIKPIRGFDSQLGFRIENQEDIERAIPIIRNKIHRIGKAFTTAMEHADLPSHIAQVTGSWCIAEQLVGGRQCGIEGYFLDGEFHVHGVVDGVKDNRLLSFTRWEYPSAWPQQVQQRMCETAERLLRKMGYDNAPFGVEYFWDEKNDKLSLLEINTRISQSHSDQFIQVHGISNHEVPIKVALGEPPELEDTSGRYAQAAKFMLRRYSGDAVVTRIPTPDEIRELEQRWPGTTIRLRIKEGMRLSDVESQDSYSFEIAEIWLGAASQVELLERYHRLAKDLHIEFSDGSQIEDFQFEKVRY